MPSPTNNAPAPTPLTANGACTGCQTVAVNMQNGVQINLPQYPVNLSQSVQTVGVNGSTTMLLGQLNSITQQLAAQGQLTPNQASALALLANQGHEIAAIEGTVETALKGAVKSGSKPTQPVTFEGTTYANITDLAATLGILTNGQKKPGQQDLSNAYNQVLASGALNDPALKSVVDSLTGNISQMAHVLSENTRGGTSPAQILQAATSQIANTNSSSICQAGLSTDTGTHCH